MKEQGFEDKYQAISQASVPTPTISSQDQNVSVVSKAINLDTFREMHRIYDIVKRKMVK